MLNVTGINNRCLVADERWPLGVVGKRNSGSRVDGSQLRSARARSLAGAAFVNNAYVAIVKGFILLAL